jgi:hypothetical protein
MRFIIYPLIVAFIWLLMFPLVASIGYNQREGIREQWEADYRRSLVLIRQCQTFEPRKSQPCKAIYLQYARGYIDPWKEHQK